MASKSRQALSGGGGRGGGRKTTATSRSSVGGKFAKNKNIVVGTTTTMPKSSKTKKYKRIKTEPPSLPSPNNNKKKTIHSNDRTDDTVLGATVDTQGLGIAEAFDRERRSSSVSGPDEQQYQGPGPLKWRIFEAAARTNGQRAFGVYWSALKEFMSGRLPRSELDDAVLDSLGAENVRLHNELILCLLSNAQCTHVPTSLFSLVPASCRGRVAHTDAVELATSPDKSTRGSSPKNASSSSGRGIGGTTGASAVSANGAPAPGSLKRSRAESGRGAMATAGLRGWRDDPAEHREPEVRTAVAHDPRWVRVPPRRDDSVFGSDAGGARSEIAASSGGGGKRLSGSTAARRTDVVKKEASGGGRWSNGTVRDVGSRQAMPLLAGVASVAAERSTPVRRETASIHNDQIEVKQGQECEQHEEEDRLLEDIDRMFGTRSDIWDPWAEAEQQEKRGRSLLGEKRAAPAQATLEYGSQARKALKVDDGGIASGGAHANWATGDKDAAAAADAAAAEAKRALAQYFAGSPAPATAHGGAATGYGYRSQRVPGARALAPFLQAVTASQHMKVSHEVCRVMTVGVKEYLRRVMEGCLASAKRENFATHLRQTPPGARLEIGVGRAPSIDVRSATKPVGVREGGAALSMQRFPPSPRGLGRGVAQQLQEQTQQTQAHLGPKGTAPIGAHHSAGNGAARSISNNFAAYPGTGTNLGSNNAYMITEWGRSTPSGRGSFATQPPLELEPRDRRPSPHQGSGSGGAPNTKRVLTPGHLRAALEASPRLGGPPSAARAQWRRVAYAAGVGTVLTGGQDLLEQSVRNRHSL